MGSAFQNRNTNTEKTHKESQDLNKWLKRNVSGDEFKHWFRHDPNPGYTALRKIEQQLKDHDTEA